jgi:hypothetical protein
MDELDAFTLAPGAESDRLRAYLRDSWIHLDLGRARMGFLYALSGISLLVWISSGWPDLLPEELSRLVWKAWLVASLGLVGAGALEWRWRRRKNLSLARLGSPVYSVRSPAPVSSDAAVDSRSTPARERQGGRAMTLMDRHPWRKE